MTRPLPVLALSTAIVAGDAMADQETISVTVTYRERIALPPDAILEVELLDVSRADAPSTTLSYMRFKQDGVPFETVLPYDPAMIDERFSYVIAARILSGGSVMFRTTSTYPVLTAGAGNEVEALLQMTAEDGDPSSDVLSGIADIEWTAIEVNGVMFAGDDPPTLMVRKDGAFGLFGGCNRFSGQAELGNGTVTFPKTFAGTLRACPQPVEQMEQDVVEALTASTRFERDDGTLVLSREDGTVTLRFHNKS